MKSFILLTTLISFPSFATVWITLSSPHSDKIAVIGASSGLIGDYRTMVHEDNHGIAVVGSWYLGKNQGPLKDLLKNQSLSAEYAAQEFSRLINLDSYKRRISMVNSRFENASVPGRGCHENNYYCGKFEDDNFTITGGGLVGPEVITAAKDAIEQSSAAYMPIECQLYKGIEAIFKSGGEIKKIERVALLVDDLKKKNDGKIHLLKRKGDEMNLLHDLRSHLQNTGYDCN